MLKAVSVAGLLGGATPPEVPEPEPERGKAHAPPAAAPRLQVATVRVVDGTAWYQVLAPPHGSRPSRTAWARWSQLEALAGKLRAAYKAPTTCRLGHSASIAPLSFLWRRASGVA